MAISFTLTEWVIVGLVLLFGWVLGLLSSGAGKKWKARYEEERQAHADTRAAHAEALQAEQNRLRTLETRNRELERGHAAAPAAATTTAAAATPAAASHATAGDDLSRIRGIGTDGRDRLAEDGITSYRDVETLDGDRAADIERRYGMAPGTIDREDWRGQARTLREAR